MYIEGHADSVIHSISKVYMVGTFPYPPLQAVFRSLVISSLIKQLLPHVTTGAMNIKIFCRDSGLPVQIPFISLYLLY